MSWSTDSPTPRPVLGRDELLEPALIGGTASGWADGGSNNPSSWGVHGLAIEYCGKTGGRIVSEPINKCSSWSSSVTTEALVAPVAAVLAYGTVCSEAVAVCTDAAAAAAATAAGRISKKTARAARVRIGDGQVTGPHGELLDMADGDLRRTPADWPMPFSAQWQHGHGSRLRACRTRQSLCSRQLDRWPDGQRGGLDVLIFSTEVIVPQ